MAPFIGRLANVDVRIDHELERARLPRHVANTAERVEHLGASTAIGFGLHITKPADPKQLVKAVRRLAGREE